MTTLIFIGGIYLMIVILIGWHKKPIKPINRRIADRSMDHMLH